MKGKLLFIFNRVCLYGYFVGIFILVVCLTPYSLLDWILILPIFAAFIFPLGSFVGVIPYGFFRWNTPISYQQIFSSYSLYYPILTISIAMQTYIDFQILKNKLDKIYFIVVFHHFGVGFFYLTNFTIIPLITQEARISVILLVIYGLLLNLLAVFSFERGKNTFL